MNDSRADPLFRRSHSHIVRTFQPIWVRRSVTSTSRSLLPVIFSTQKPIRVFGHLNRWHSCPCQKHPLTKTAVRYLGKTRSGEPGRLFRWSRNLSPRSCNILRSKTSGEVFRDRMPAIILLRTSGVTTSAKNSDFRSFRLMLPR